MRLRIFSLLILLCFSFLSCNQSSSDTTSKTPDTTIKSKTESSGHDWDAIKAQLALNDTELDNLKRVARKYKRKQKTLQTEKKWAGKENESNRQSWERKKQKAVVRAIGKAKGDQFNEIAENSKDKKSAKVKSKKDSQ